MAVFVVTWDLNKEKTNYAAARATFVKHLNAYENIRDQGLDSVRFISTSDSAHEIVEYLEQKLDDNDCLFVSRLRSDEYQGRLRESVWSWISARE